MRLVSLLASAALAGCAHAPPQVASVEDARSLAAAESDFAAHSVREDMRAAFIAHFAPDGVFVRGGWVVAKDDLAGRTAPPIVLDWKPVYAEVAASGEMGLSTGPWKITSKTDPNEAPAFGQFVSIWKREPGQPWRVAVDLGIGHPAATFWDATLETSAASGSGAPQGSLEAAERIFAQESAANGARSAYSRFASPRLRLYRGGEVPALGKSAALASPRMSDERTTWTVERSETARSGDFAYARGSYAPAPGAKPDGYFMRAWRFEGGAWRIALDVINPASR